ncbi:GAF domain-containing sensor histidine kinase [Amantichitinum ursilacus]|uniref:histidine kinase n=1 Tax=Amantichitinum ursilacus TaxID=857265 RepID=A0A0N1JSC9_9NEIS|nr:GAF domain-containing sensor histidine kinase [Amantichitinum ursilacus]KPC51894.1 Bacteriophytochrome [Amantichitinum ursilacus]
MHDPIADDVAAIQSIEAVPTILQVIAQTTGMRFACVARVTQDRWTVCAVHDAISFGLTPGDELQVATTLCSVVRDTNAGVIIDHVSEDPDFHDHPCPAMYGFESYISIPLYRRNGEYFGTLCALDPLPADVSNSATVNTFNLFSQLISSQLQTEDELRASQAALLTAQQTAELREQFIAVLGHDLRTPLASILMGADVLLKRPLDESTASILLRIRKSGARISTLVDDVLDFARGRMGGGIMLTRRWTDTLGADLRQVAAETQSNFEGRAIKVEINIDAQVFCDPTRIAQLLSNLMNNALTHGAPAVPVSVAANVVRERLCISVSNGGSPIPAQTLPNLFKPYWRGAAADANTGLGLGLYIVSEIAQSHGGELVVTSDAEQTCFTFTLPLTPQRVLN